MEKKDKRQPKADKPINKDKGTASKTNWNSEVKKSGLIILKVTGKIFTYILNVIFTLLLVCLITGTVVGIAFMVYINNYIEVDVSEITTLSSEQALTSRIYYYDYKDQDARANREGSPILVEDQELFATENRTWVSYSQMPTELIEAYVSIEDERFWDHNGVDWKRTAGATFNFMMGNASYGGSTITQQLIKNVTGEDDVTMQRKIKEIMTALELEKELDKTQIIEMYLNTIYLSEHCYGVQAAANVYFGKDVGELNLAECAALASIPKYPYKYDPYVHPENNTERRALVLGKLKELGKITDAQYDEWIDYELVLSSGVSDANTADTTSWYTDVVISDTIDLLMEKLGVSETVANRMLYAGGLEIYTVMDKEVQDILEDYFENPDNFAKVNDGVQPEASMVIVDPQTGDVLALVGGRGEKTDSLVLNYATMTTRSPGSSIKPVAVYGPALEYGVINYGSVIEDSPVDASKRWPANYPAGYKGPTTVHDAVRRSVNTVSVKVLQKLGVDASYDFVYNKLGMTSVIDEYETKSGQVLSDKNLSALGMGGMNYGVTVREITGAYQVFANKGVVTGTRTVLKILDSDGKVIVDNSGEENVVMSEQNASLMTVMLQEVVSTGTASKMTFDEKIDVAGKTGTTSDDCDRWFIGYTPYYIGGVWFGYAMPMSLNGFSETMSPALLIWEDVMELVHEAKVFSSGEPVKEFVQADGISAVRICTVSGLKPTEYCTGHTEYSYFTSSTVPTKYCSYHVPDTTSEKETEKPDETKDKDKDDPKDTTGGADTTGNEPTDTTDITDTPPADETQDTSKEPDDIPPDSQSVLEE